MRNTCILVVYMAVYVFGCYFNTTVNVIILLSDEPTGCQLPNGLLSPVIDVSFAVLVMNPIRVCRSMENVRD